MFRRGTCEFGVYFPRRECQRSEFRKRVAILGTTIKRISECLSNQRKQNIQVLCLYSHFSNVFGFCSHDFASKKEYLEVDINDLGKFDPKLRTLLEDDPMSVLPTVSVFDFYFEFLIVDFVKFEKVASEIARSIHSSENDDDVLEAGIQIILKSSLNDKALGSSLRALTVKSFYQVLGFMDNFWCVLVTKNFEISSSSRNHHWSCHTTSKSRTVRFWILCYRLKRLI